MAKCLQLFQLQFHYAVSRNIVTIPLFIAIRMRTEITLPFFLSFLWHNKKMIHLFCIEKKTVFFLSHSIILSVFRNQCIIYFSIQRHFCSVFTQNGLSLLYLCLYVQKLTTKLDLFHRNYIHFGHHIVKSLSNMYSHIYLCECVVSK